MPSSQGKNPWHDRFAAPVTDDLETLYDPEIVEILSSLRAHIKDRTGAAHTTEWRGVAWKWTLVYRRPEDEEPWAYIIPAEPHPMLALPVPAAPLPESEFRRLPRFIRDALRFAPRVGQVCWLEIPVSAASHVEDLDRFIGLVTEAQPA